jgi:nitrogen regulatory protein PII
MDARKRLEIIVTNPEAKPVLQLLDKHGIKHYSMIRDVSGRGDRGIQDGKGLSETFINVMIVCYITTEAFEAVKESLRTELSRHGGVAVVSDVNWLKH